MTATGRLRRINAGSSGILDAARCPACNHHARVHNVVGCVSAHCECVVTRAELMPNAPRLEVPDGIESTPAATPAAPAGGDDHNDANRREGQADAPAAPDPVRPGPRWDPPRLPPHTPGAGWERVKRELPGIVPEITEADERRVDEIITKGKEAAARLYARRSSRQTNARPAVPTAQVSRAVVGEPDAVEEVAVARSTVATATDPPEPEPLDLAPFLNAALTYYAAWGCPRHPLQRRHDPGACPECSGALVPVYVVVAPRSLT